MIAHTRLGIGLLVVALGLAACGGDGGEPADNQATTTSAGIELSTAAPPTETELTRATFPSGATVEYPANWTSYGAGASTGSLELAIPQTANVSLRDAAASDYLYGGLFTEADSLEGAWSVMAAMLGVSDLVPETLASADGRTILHAISPGEGVEMLLGLIESDGAYASVFAPSLAGSLSPDTVSAILDVLTSITP